MRHKHVNSTVAFVCCKHRLYAPYKSATQSLRRLAEAERVLVKYDRVSRDAGYAHEHRRRMSVVFVCVFSRVKFSPSVASRVLDMRGNGRSRHCRRALGHELSE